MVATGLATTSTGKAWYASTPRPVNVSGTFRPFITQSGITIFHALRLARRDAHGPFDLPPLKPPWGWISELDMNTCELLWHRPNSRTPDEIQAHPQLAGFDIPDTGNDDRSAMLVTKPLLFSGDGAGMYGARWGGKLFRAHDKRSGEIVAEMDLGQRQTGVPMTYAIGGQQYIVVATGVPGQAGQLVALTVNREALRTTPHTPGF